jgi:flagellar biosynthesis protein FlhF
LPPAAEAVAHLRRVARAALKDPAPGLVLHARQTVAWPGRRGQWSGAAWFDGQGGPLAAATQQVGLADGWYTPEGASLQAPSAVDSLLAQAAAESADAAVPPCHVFEGGGQSLLRALESAGRIWVAACGARTRVHEADGASVISAVARRLVHQPLDPQALSGLRAPAGLAAGSAAWWAGSGLVELRARGDTPLPVRAFSLRAVDPADGRILRVWHALGSLGTPSDPAWMARALVLRQEFHALARMSAGLLAGDAGREPLIDRAVYFAQLGLAAWHLAQGRALASAARVAARMMGADELPPRQAPAGLLKLFTLKELLAG